MVFHRLFLRPRSALSPSPMLLLLLFHALMVALLLRPCAGAGVPSPPTVLRGAGVEPTSVTLRWLPDRTSVEPATSYVIQYYELPSEPGGRRGRLMEETDIMPPFYTVQHLKPHTKYSFSILGVNSWGRSRPSQSVELETGQLGWFCAHALL
ncbi:receptor-type tyrosine-protein phosphatase F [Elysia marginata]|uniref:Receptor-type tyrosine-protein phosphatase F n=1 Tax=Elysia marginata TaxID=1093978 RepID=A0AAV4EVS3_9GAST|nr:receptor-type tyrosine-protein phosphatase F [Elysia marginata]